MRTLTAATLAGAVMLVGGCAHAVGGNVDVRVVDRTTGETLPMYRHGGKWWVPGKPGSHYAVALTNRGGGRVLAVIAVDGINAISGETAAPEQTGYVLSSGQSAQITGWRKDMSRVAAFEFTALANSYAARTGRPDNVGVIGVAVFREKVRHVPPPTPPMLHEKQSSRDASSPAPAAGALADASGSGEAARRSERAQESRIGTGHGRTEHSATTYTQFERASSTPDELITIHYDSRDNLIAMGVMPIPSTS
ncbi:MAG: hypothetical protein ACXWVT_11370, partial [Burkholderiaceae bacterium]